MAAHELRGIAKKARLEGRAGLGATWLLDKASSESMGAYLQLMGLSELAIEAWTKAERETDTYKA